MRDRDLERFQDNYAADAEALPLVAELHATYGEEFLCECLFDPETLHTLPVMVQVKRDLEDKFLVAVKSDEDCFEEKLKLDVLFPNIKCIMDYNKLLEILEKKGWIWVFKIVDESRSLPHWRVIGKSIFSKGHEWDKCPREIQNHFLGIKKENHTCKQS